MSEARDDEAPEAEGELPDEGASARRFPIVGIGASAGGIEALEPMLRRFTLDSMAFVLALHLAPGQEQHLPELLSRWTTLPVLLASDGLTVEKNHLYVIPSGANLALLHGTMHLIEPPPEQPHRPVDSFFRSLAEDRGAFAIGVVLSGTGNDGTLGLRAIKAEGGITFVQKPDTARFDGMPTSAIEAGVADFVLSPEGIADELMAVSHHAYLKHGRAQRVPTPERLGKVFVLLRDAFGHDLSLYKHGTIERRIERRMAVHKIERLEDYLAVLQSRPAELATLYHDLLIGVTAFFRDRVPYEVLSSVVLDRLAARRPESPIRVWVPGCSTGEEPYSIAIALLERLGDRGHEHKIQVFATDVDDEAVQFGRRGVYPAQIALDVSAERLQRFFVPRQGGYQVCRRVRDMVVFASQNVTKDPPFSRLDLVSCRNLLIYLQAPLQKKVLRIFHYALVPDGHLLLGTSESVGDSPDLFSLIDRQAKLYRKKNIPSSATFDVAFGESAPRGVSAAAHLHTDTRPMANIQQLADRRVLERYGPPGVVINENLEVLQFRGRTGPYLEPLPGNASLNLLKLARPELVADLRAAVHRVLDTNAPVIVRRVPLLGADGQRHIEIEVLPLIDPETRSRCMVVAFSDPGGEAAALEARSAHADAADESPPRVRELELELTATKEYLQSAIEELETSNEELKSANEELQSANEELQSTNEELETSKEELQSTNEELTTVNDELHCRMVELSQSNDDLQNLMILVETAVVIVGLDQRIRRYTQAAEKLLNLIPSDVGRPLAHLSWFVPAGALERLVTNVIEHLSARSEELTAANGRRYRVSVMAYRTAEHSIRGAALSFVEVTPEGSAPPPEPRG